MIVNETLARRHWPDEDPLGKRIKISWSDDREDEIIGVVGDVRHAGLETEARDDDLLAVSAQCLRRDDARRSERPATHAGRASSVRGDRARAGSAISPLADVQTMDEVVAQSVAQRRLMMVMLGIFAGAALLLAAVGIYGVIAYSVTQRTQEIGIRMALGAQRGDVLRMIVGQAHGLAAAGIAIGAAGAFAADAADDRSALRRQPCDPADVRGGRARSWRLSRCSPAMFPGRRATRVDPVVALRRSQGSARVIPTLPSLRYDRRMLLAGRSSSC